MAHRSRVNIIILQQYSFEKTSKPAPLGIFFFFFFSADMLQHLYFPDAYLRSGF